MTCQCPGWYEGCDHESPCGAEVDPEVAEEKGPWCASCLPNKAAAMDHTLGQMTVMLTGKEWGDEGTAP